MMKEDFFVVSLPVANEDEWGPEERVGIGASTGQCELELRLTERVGFRHFFQVPEERRHHGHCGVIGDLPQRAYHAGSTRMDERP
jgi:hypothetical protein